MSYLRGIADRVNKMDAKKNFNLLEIDIEDLRPSKNNFYGIRELDNLVESIKENGLMHNLLVRKLEDGKYEIVSGHRRFYALLRLEYKKIPCQVKDMNDLDSEIHLIQANAQQRELSHIEKMKGVERLAELYKFKKANGEEVPKGKTRDIIGKDIGLSGVQVGRYMKVSEKLIEPLKDKLEEGSITLTQATTLSSLKEHEQEHIHDHIDSIGTKECKQEVDILIQGIKQPVESKNDVELVKEIEKKTEEYVKQEIENKLSNKRVDNNEVSKDINHDYEELKQRLSKDNHPKAVITNKYYEGIFLTQTIDIADKEIRIMFRGYSISNKLRVILGEVTKVNEIKLMDSSLKPKEAFKIAEGVYLWFNIRKEE